MDQQKEVVEFHGKGFRSGSVFYNIGIATFFGLLAINISFMLNFPMLITVIIFVAVILFVLQALGAKITYRVDEFGIHQEIRPLMGKRKTKTISTPWKEIKSYVVDSDRNRSMETYYFLKVRATHPSTIRVTANTAKKDAFDAFVKSFEEFVNQAKAAEPSITDPVASSQIKSPVHIEKMRSFYQRPIGRSLSILFFLVTIALVYYSSQTTSNVTSWYIVSYIIIPGTFYMLYRSYGPDSYN